MSKKKIYKTGDLISFDEHQAKVINDQFATCEGIERGLISLSESLHIQEKKIWSLIEAFYPAAKDCHKEWNRKDGTLKMLRKK